MAIFKNILVALDLSKDVDLILEKARNLSDAPDVNLTLIHVIEPIVLDVNIDFVPSPSLDLEASLVTRGELFLKHTIERLALKNVTSMVPLGSVKHEIHREAQSIHADLIVIGSHGRHGVALLLGSTANSVLHGAPCDVLTVKIG